MITQAQYDALGPIGREIIDTDRALAAISRRPIVGLKALRRARGLRQDRRMLAGAAAILCRRPRDGSSPRCA